MSNDILQLNPKALWKNFYSLTQIPRPSKKEDQIREFIYNFGKNLGLETIVDEVGNVIIRKPATPGMENRKGVVLQGREILRAELEPAAPPYLSVIPAGTSLRAFYVTDRGDAFVDLSSEISSAHGGGSATELLTVYAIVNVVTANLPSVQRVQILINGREADTLAGHVDLRRPLQSDQSLVRAE